MANTLSACIMKKVEHQLERTDHLISMVPESSLDWSPPYRGGFPVGVLLGHLLECAAGFCAALMAAHPDRLSHFTELRKLPLNGRCAPQEARARLSLLRERIREGFAALEDADLGRAIPTVFVKEGEALLTLLLNNLEHLSSHKEQLFLYLRMLDVRVGSADLYRFSGA
jgi:hypothetical protein